MPPKNMLLPHCVLSSSNVVVFYTHQSPSPSIMGPWDQELSTGATEAGKKGGGEQGGGEVRGQEAAKGVDAHLASCLRIAKIPQLRVPAISNLVAAALLSAALTRDSATDNHNSKPTHPSPISSPYLSSHTVSTNKHPSNCHLPTYLF